MNGKLKRKIALVLGTCFCIGILILVFGIKENIEFKNETKNYEVTEGYFIKSQLESEGGYDVARDVTTSNTYRLMYTYTVNGQEYTLKTDYATSFVPKVGSIKKIKYDANQPQKAVMEDGGKATVIIFVGAIFLVVTAVITLSIFTPGKLKISSN